MGLVMLMAGMTTTAQETPADGGGTNPAMGTVQSEVLDDKAADDLWRDPFWPVGYLAVKTASDAGSSTADDPLASDTGPVAEATLQRALSMINVEGIIKRGSKCFATVNGTMVGAGDEIHVMVDGRQIVFIVRSIDMKRLRIEPIRR